MVCHMCISTMQWRLRRATPRKTSQPCKTPAEMVLSTLQCGETMCQLCRPFAQQRRGRHMVCHWCLSAMWKLWVATPARKSVPCESLAALDLRSLHGKVLSQVRASSWSKSSRRCIVFSLCVSALWVVVAHGQGRAVKTTRRSCQHGRARRAAGTALVGSQRKGFAEVSRLCIRRSIWRATAMCNPQPEHRSAFPWLCKSTAHACACKT